MDTTKLGVGGPDPGHCVEHADDGSAAARATDLAQIDPVDPDPAAGLRTGPADGPCSD